MERARTLVANFRKVEMRTVIEDQTYAGKPVEPIVPATDVSLEGVDYAVQDKDYTVSYESNVHAGTASVILTFAGDFTGTARKTFAIKQAPLTVSAVSAMRPYDGTELTTSYTSEGLIAGDSISSANVTGSQTNVGKSACEVKDVVVENGCVVRGHRRPHLHCHVGADHPHVSIEANGGSGSMDMMTVEAGESATLTAPQLRALRPRALRTT